MDAMPRIDASASQPKPVTHNVTGEMVRANIGVPSPFKEIKMIRWAVSVANRQPMSNRFRDIRFRGLRGIQDGLPPRKMSRQRGGERTAGAMRMAGVDKLSLQDIEKPSVIEQIGGPFGEQM